MTAARLPACPCPLCKATLDAASWIPDGGPPATPAPGDVTVCAYCGVLLLFDGEPLALRTPTFAEMAELSALPELLKAQAIVARHGLKARILARRPPED